RQILGSHADQVAALYQHHDGFVLYRDTKSEAAGIELLSVEQWEQATEDMRDWFDHLADEPENDPDHIVTGISIAAVPHSGNYFVMPIEGPSAGKIFYADHAAFDATCREQMPQVLVGEAGNVQIATGRIDGALAFPDS